jgi:hypothetical protein
MKNTENPLCELSLSNHFARSCLQKSRTGWYQLFSIAFVWLALGSAAFGLTLEWDVNPEPEVAGYRLYYGTLSGVYSYSADAGPSTSISVPDLISGVTYFFAVTAYSAEGLESPPSNEIVVTIPPPEGMIILAVTSDKTPDWVKAVAQENLLSIFPGAFSSPENVFSFFISGPVAEAVSIEASADLFHWTTLATVLNPTGILIASDTGATRDPRRFYRLRGIASPSLLW